MCQFERLNKLQFFLFIFFKATKRNNYQNGVKIITTKTKEEEQNKNNNGQQRFSRLNSNCAN